MIQALKELGELKLKNEGREVSDLLSILVQDPNQNGNYPYALVVVFKKTQGELLFERVDLEESSNEKVKKYLYRFKASQGPDFTPTSKIAGDVEKTFRKKIEKWFEKQESEAPLVISFKKSFLSSKDDIFTNIRDKLNEISKTKKPGFSRNQGCFVTFAFLNDEKISYLGDFSEFQELLIEAVKHDYRRIAKGNHICSVCGLIKEEVFGAAIPITFYTLDKPGYIAGGFRKEDAWKNAPVCLECSLKIEEGKRFLDECLRFRMGGARYYLLPNFILGEEEAKEVIFDFFQAAKEREVLAQKTLKRFSEDEQEILEFLSHLKDVLSFNFLFYETPTKSVFRINLLVEDILPSRLSTLFKAKTKAEDNDIFKNVKMGEKYENIELRFSNLTRQPSDNVPSLIPSRKAFLEVVDKVFRGVSLDRELIFSWFMATIRRMFANEGYFKPYVLQAFVLLLFLKELGILPSKTKIEKGGALVTVKLDVEIKAEQFFESYDDMFNSAAHKALFLLGVLAQKLLNIQFRVRNSTPFRKQLKGLRMKESDFRGLLPKIQNKLEEYGKNYYRDVEKLISDYFIQTGRNWQMSKDEMNFYFVLGMNLQDKVSQILGITKEEGSYE